ncbi:uncharacterized protein LOC128259309 [Drosophila gunungcola]|uniref:Uncharacterized protein n=1 Tax=Drosophila gunungcola TaxID=103775 RepID=A0A9P9YMH7_9MUSC|nr:uncharacterized protein LOC128259309 [Drosophila gunungcola]KAI8039353.1 hypothetical protein M5D96_008076 [Drosophila gunungcola]
MTEGTRRSERIRRIQLERSMAREANPNPAGQGTRALFVVANFSPPPRQRRSRRFVPQLEIISDPEHTNRTIFMPLHLSNRRNRNQMIRSVLLPVPENPPSVPQRVRYISVANWSFNNNTTLENRGVLLMVMLVDPSLDTEMRRHRSIVISTIQRIAAYFLF